MPDTKDYVEMQENFYKPLASQWQPELPNRNHVVGWFEEHSAWPGYNHLFEGIDTQDMVALDFGCGPGRGIVLYWDKFKRVDGVDLMQENLDNARRWVSHNNLDVSSINLYKCNGSDLNDIPSNQYDFIYSMICMQHICVWDIRYSYLKEFFRVLTPGGYVSIQMGFGRRPQFKNKGYYENFYEARKTNGDDLGEWDVTVEDPKQLEKDLKDIGYQDFTYVIDKPFLGEQDTFPEWIYFRARKPL